MGLRCPGPRTLPFYVHAVADSCTKCPPKPGGSPASARCVAIAPRTSPTPTLPGPPPSRASAFDQLFVSHFIESFLGPIKTPPALGPPSNVWVHELPVFLASPEPSLSKHAIRAASMLSYGSLASDVSIKIEACKWYAKALIGLRYLLSCGGIPFSESALCATTMLIHFETWAGTSRRAWLQHIKGASMLLGAAGPEQCRDGFMHQIFSHLRFQTVCLRSYGP